MSEALPVVPGILSYPAGTVLQDPRKAATWWVILEPGNDMAFAELWNGGDYDTWRPLWARSAAWCSSGGESGSRTQPAPSPKHSPRHTLKDVSNNQGELTESDGHVGWNPRDSR